MKSRNIIVSTHEVFKLSGLTAPNDHLFSKGLCIKAPDATVFPIQQTDIRIITSYKCTGDRNRVKINDNLPITVPDKPLPLEGPAPVPYMFYLLNQSTIILNINVTSWKRVKEIGVFLLKDHDVYEQCMWRHKPSTPAKEICHVDQTKPCNFNMTVKTQGHYFLCIFMSNGTAVGTYSMKIDPFWQYEVSGTEKRCHLHQRGDPIRNCCVSYDTNIFSHKPCHFLATNRTDRKYLGEYFKLTVSPQRHPVIWYSLGVLGLCAVIALVLTVSCVATWRKVKNPDMPGCSIRLYPQLENNHQAEPEQRAHV